MGKAEMITRMLVVAAMIAVSARAAAAQDVAKGEIIFHQCMICHSVGGNAKNKIGPELDGLDGRHSGTAPNYNYSDVNKNSGIVWSERTFKQYIVDPRAMIPGTKMPFAGIKDPSKSTICGPISNSSMPTAASRNKAAG
jgi:cytochrome c